MTHQFHWGGSQDLSEAFSGLGVLTTDGDEAATLSRILLDAQDGTGFIEYYCGDDLRIMIFNCAFRRRRAFEVHDGDWVRLNFSLDLTIDMTFGGALTVHELEPSWRLIRMPQAQNVVEVVPADARLQWVTICCKPERLAQLCGVTPDDLPFRLNGAQTADDDVIYRPFPLSPPLKTLTSHVIGGLRPRGGLARSYLARKADELMILALDHLLHDHDLNSLQVRLSERDVEALHVARDILDRQMAAPPTVKALSQRVGVNRNKLFYGFKTLFGVSVAEYVQEQRINLAHHLVTTTDAPLSDIANKVGFRYQCNLSTAFKARYQTTPLALRRKGGFRASVENGSPRPTTSG
ncbi:AraC family transcriptional regulator [Brevundimonas sp. SORGH_AS_0993]|uniref:helix-turn-helix domain-containing protein n=1 Tax=Brevundimonas sp. SORGH_AS_0993 TaxID=3041794 RepID=UPI00277DCBE6|nr:AraC family transcriptional regulator [Brevundimonas sp. SORGH_AS_0993]MDQ1154490.1 AraC-like DNA-binding protein [Brevundimonas sp. SORGH_AS_0993]